MSTYTRVISAAFEDASEQLDASLNNLYGLIAALDTLAVTHPELSRADRGNEAIQVIISMLCQVVETARENNSKVWQAAGGRV